MNINGIELDTIKDIPDKRLLELILTADGKGVKVKQAVLIEILNRDKVRWDKSKFESNTEPMYGWICGPE